MSRLLLAFTIALALCADAALAGDIVGTVTLQSPLAPRASGKSLQRGYGSSDEGGYGGSYDGGTSRDDRAVRLSKADETRYVVLYLVSTSGALKATPGTGTIRQKDKEFVPHVLPVVRGSDVLFTNDDRILHHIYSVTQPGAFEIPKYSRGQSKKLPFKGSGAVEVFCGIHSRMNAYVFVVDNDFFTMPASNGKFAIRGVPPGTYQLRAWHPRAKAAVKTVTVPASGSVSADVTL